MYSEFLNVFFVVVKIRRRIKNSITKNEEDDDKYRWLLDQVIHYLLIMDLRDSDEQMIVIEVWIQILEDRGILKTLMRLDSRINMYIYIHIYFCLLMNRKYEFQ